MSQNLSARTLLVGSINEIREQAPTLIESDVEDIDDIEKNCSEKLQDDLESEYGIESNATDRYENDKDDGTDDEEENALSHLETTEEDFYGQRHPIETPKLIFYALKELNAELENIPSEKKTEFLYATEHCPELVDDAHKLMFLRCDLFQPKLAAKRLVNYWKVRVEVFGGDDAYHPLTLNNMFDSEEDRAALSKELLLLPPVLDSMGRSIVCFNVRVICEYQEIKTLVNKLLWYMFHAALERESSQQKGIVALISGRGATISIFDRKMLEQVLNSVKGCIPVRISSIHLIEVPSFFRMMWPVIKVMLGPRLRKRVRMTAKNIEKTLGKCGIQMNSMPLQVGGKYDHNHGEWLERRRASGL